MRIINKNTVFLFLGLGLLASCSSSDNAAPVYNLPEKPYLSLPVNGETCSDYTVVAGDDSKAEISFSWETTALADSYVLMVTDAGKIVISEEVSGTSYSAVLDKGKTYNWTITAKNGDGANVSKTFSFSTPGQAIGNYVPYAAVINFNVNKTTSMASLSWTGRDKDSDASTLKYHVEVKEDGSVIQSSSNQTATSIADFAVKLNSQYEIKIVTIDELGSYSNSILTYTNN